MKFKLYYIPVFFGIVLVSSFAFYLLFFTLPSYEMITKAKRDQEVYGQVIAKLQAKYHFTQIYVESDPYINNGKRIRVPIDPDHGKSFYCGIGYPLPERTDYKLKTFKSEDKAKLEDYYITHKGRCGACSTLQDLTVYMEYEDLTTTVRKCASQVLIKKKCIKCLMSLGFTEECALIWYYNALNTSKVCFWPCIKSWIVGESFNKSDGSLNDCLKCDEENSGPIFKYTAGRTRRNSGIETAIKRGDEELYNVIHDYY